MMTENENIPEEENNDETVPFPEGNTEETEASPEEVTELSVDEQLAKALEELAQSNDQLLRTKAEMENVRRRTRNELDEQRKFQALGLARDLLPGLDNLQRALDAGSSSGNIEELLKGLEMVAQQMHSALNVHGIKKIEAVGKPFDPKVHEAIQNMPSEEIPAMHVIAEAEVGYILNERVVRPSKVLVSSGPAEAATE